MRTFSSTERWANTAEIWNERTTPRRAIAADFSAVMSSPSNRICPDVGTRNLVSRLKHVVLPAPFGPISAWIVPRRTRRFTLSTATKPLNSFVNSFVSRMKSPPVMAMGTPSCCALRYSPWERPGGSCRFTGRARRVAADPLGQGPGDVERGVAVAGAAVGAEKGLVDADGNGRRDVAGRTEHRRTERVDAFANATVIDAVAAPARQRQLPEQRRETARATLGEAHAQVAGEQARHLGRRKLRQHRLAAARQVRRQAHADVEGQPERPGIVAHGDVESLAARQHREHDRLFGRAAAIGPERVEFPGDVGAREFNALWTDRG